MKTMGRWVPIPDMLEWWIPLGVAIPVCAFFLWKAWRYRETYFRWMIVFHVLYLGWFVIRGVGAVLTSSRLDSSRYFYRGVMLLLAVFLVASTYSQAKKRLEKKRVRKLRMAGPSETLWSPDPIVGYRFSIHSWEDVYFRGQRAYCRYGSEFHSSAEVPTWGCRCGYYAYKSVSTITNSFPSGRRFGVIVLMWGKVLEHERGYRGEYMRPIGYIDTKPVVNGYFDYYRGFHDLPVVRTDTELDALIEKARKEFDPDASPPYDGEYNGYRQADTED